MDLKVFSVYDKVSKQSIFITMHHTVAEAKREFIQVITKEPISEKASDLELYCIGDFNTSTLELYGCEPFKVEV